MAVGLSSVGGQPQLFAAYSASTDVETGSSSIEPSAVTATLASGTDVARVVKACDTALPGATVFDCFVPYVVDTETATGTSSSLMTLTTSTTLPETQRVL